MTTRVICIDDFTKRDAVVPQGNSCILRFPLTDYDRQTPVPQANIATATMTLLDDDTGEVINEREAVNIKSNFDDNGWCSITLTADDNVIVSDREDITEEVHVAVIRVSASGAEQPISLVRELGFKVGNQTHVPNEE